MNDSQKCAPAPEQPSLMRRVSQLQGLNHELNHSFADFYALVDRLQSIGYRLNPDQHPDNIPKDAMPLDKKPSPIETRPVEGLQGHIDQLIDDNNRSIREINNGILVKLNNYISYIEQHI